MSKIKLSIVIENPNWASELEDSIQFFSKRLYDIQFADISLNAKKKAIDMDYRIITDLISCRLKSVSHSTPYIIKNCKWWSKKAVELFSKTEGTISERCNLKINGKRAYSVEHEYPVGIIKNKIVNKQFKSQQEIVNYIKEYGRVIIVHCDENYRLTVNQKTANTIEEAHNRYNKVGIEIISTSATEMHYKSEVGKLLAAC